MRQPLSRTLRRGISPNFGVRSKCSVRLFIRTSLMRFSHSLSPAVTRTLTVLYSTTLLTIFTNIQLSLLGRYKYIQSVIQLERDEESRSRLQYELSLSSVLFPSLIDLTRPHDVEALLSQQTGFEDGIWREGVDAETESKFLTLSWWILNVGWKDVGERVRRGVEEVFEG